MARVPAGFDPGALLHGEARGDLARTGVWDLSTDGGDAIARYDWKGDTTKAWMTLLEPIARPCFARNHNIIMGWGAEGLAKHLGVKVVELKPAGH